jgi:flagellar hook-basal body protein
VNKQGHQVLGDGGAITFKPEGGRISISADGSLVQGEQAVGRLPIYDFKDTDRLRRIGDGMLAADDPKVQPQPVEKPEIVSGMLETSNVQPLQEMVNMITVSRAYEANQRLINTEDDILAKGIQTLGGLSA